MPNIDIAYAPSSNRRMNVYDMQKMTWLSVFVAKDKRGPSETMPFRDNLPPRLVVSS